MHRHVIAHGNHFARAVKDRAGIIAAFFDVGRKCGAAQGRAHLFRNGVEEAFEDFQFNRIAHSQSLLNNADDTDGTDQIVKISVISVISGKVYEREFLISRSAATNTKNTTAITPFMVKNAALNLLRSSDATSECS